MKPISRRSSLLLLLLLLLLAAIPAAVFADDSGTLLFLVRHAEKAKGDDPALTEAGQARARALADLLDEAGIQRIFSSDYRRTVQTARPLAERLGQEVLLYDPRNLAGMAAHLKASGGRQLVVGHSNTTPELVKQLGGDPGEPIVEATEYDRLYLLNIRDGEVTTVLLRYGER